MANNRVTNRVSSPLSVHYTIDLKRKPLENHRFVNDFYSLLDSIMIKMCVFHSVLSRDITRTKVINCISGVLVCI
jgi:hypothetical protein